MRHQLLKGLITFFFLQHASAVFSMYTRFIPLAQLNINHHLTSIDDLSGNIQGGVGVIENRQHGLFFIGEAGHLSSKIALQYYPKQLSLFEDGGSPEVMHLRTIRGMIGGGSYLPLQKLGIKGFLDIHGSLDYLALSNQEKLQDLIECFNEAGSGWKWGIGLGSSIPWKKLHGSMDVSFYIPSVENVSLSTHLFQESFNASLFIAAQPFSALNRLKVFLKGHYIDYIPRQVDKHWLGEENPLNAFGITFGLEYFLHSMASIHGSVTSNTNKPFTPTFGVRLGTQGIASKRDVIQQHMQSYLTNRELLPIHYLSDVHYTSDGFPRTMQAFSDEASAKAAQNNIKRAYQKAAMIYANWPSKKQNKYKNQSSNNTLNWHAGILESAQEEDFLLQLNQFKRWHAEGSDLQGRRFAEFKAACMEFLEEDLGKRYRTQVSLEKLSLIHEHEREILGWVERLTHNTQEKIKKARQEGDNFPHEGEIDRLRTMRKLFLVDFSIGASTKHAALSRTNKKITSAQNSGITNSVKKFFKGTSVHEQTTNSNQQNASVRARSRGRSRPRSSSKAISQTSSHNTSSEEATSDNNESDNNAKSSKISTRPHTKRPTVLPRSESRELIRNSASQVIDDSSSEKEGGIKKGNNVVGSKQKVRAASIRPRLTKKASSHTSKQSSIISPPTSPALNKQQGTSFFPSLNRRKSNIGVSLNQKQDSEKSTTKKEQFVKNYVEKQRKLTEQSTSAAVPLDVITSPHLSELEQTESEVSDVLDNKAQDSGTDESEQAGAPSHVSSEQALDQVTDSDTHSHQGLGDTVNTTFDDTVVLDEHVVLATQLLERYKNLDRETRQILQIRQGHSKKLFSLLKETQVSNAITQLRKANSLNDWQSLCNSFESNFSNVKTLLARYDRHEAAFLKIIREIESQYFSCTWLERNFLSNKFSLDPKPSDEDPKDQEILFPVESLMNLDKVTELIGATNTRGKNFIQIDETTRKKLFEEHRQWNRLRTLMENAEREWSNINQNANAASHSQGSVAGSTSSTRPSRPALRSKRSSRHSEASVFNVRRR